MEISKVCPVCHQSFKAKRSTHIYCCSYCRKKHHKEVYYNFVLHIVKDFIGSIKKIKTRIYFSVLLDKYYKIKNSQLHIVITSYLLK